MSTEIELIGRAKAGDKQAFGELALTYRRNISGLAYRLLGDIHEAEDITQNVFIRAYLALPDFNPNHEGSFKSWLLTITSRLCIDSIRRRRPRESYREVQPYQELELTAADPCISDTIIEAEEKQLLREALLRLPANYRTAVALKYIEDLDYREIAEIMKIPIGTVGTWIRRGLKQMKSDLTIRGGITDEEYTVRSL